MTPTIPSGTGRSALAAAAPALVPAALFLATARLLPWVAGDSAIGAGLSGSLAGALAIALVGGATTTSRWLRPNPVIAAILGLCAHALLLTNSGVPWGHDTYHHVWGLSAYASELDSGNWLPLWLHRIGLGMPLPVFYAPLVFWTATPLLLLGAGPGLTLKILLLGAGAGAAAATFWVARRVTGDGAAALVAAVAIAFAPYRLLDAHYRVALTETAAFALLPLALYWCWRYLDAGGRGRLAAAASAVALLALTHVLSALMVAVVVGTGWLVASLTRSRPLADWWRCPRRLAALAGLGVLLGACFLLPVAADLPATWGGSPDSLVDDHYAQAGLEPADFLVRRSWDQLRLARGQEAAQPMPIYFGTALLAILLAGAVRGLAHRRVRATAEAESTVPWPTLAVIALLLALAPVARLTATVPSLRSLQFPWRFLTIATCAAALAGAAGAAWLSTILPPRWRRWIPAILAALLVADAQPMTGAALWLPAYDGFGLVQLAQAGTSTLGLRFRALDSPPPMRVAGPFLPPEGRGRAFDVGVIGPYSEWQTPAVRRLTWEPAISDESLARAGVGLWLPPGASEPTELEPAPYATWQRRVRTGAKLRACKFERAAGRIRIETPGTSGTVIVREQCFPGWQVRTAAAWQTADCTDDGTLRAEVRGGQTSLEFRFQRWTTARSLGWLGTGLGLGLVLGLWRRRAD